MPIKRDWMVGYRFGRVVVTAHAGRSMWHVKCDCGEEKTVRTDHLRRGLSQSCGCLSAEMARARNRRHGDTVGYTQTAEYRTWRKMIVRCENKNCADYYLYGARGIKVCQEWRESFAEFLAHVGRKPSPKHSIDRINNNGNYEPGNVRWATARQQRRNQRSKQEVRIAAAAVAAGSLLLSLLLVPSVSAHDYKRPDLDHWYGGLRNPRSSNSAVRSVGCCSKTDCHETQAAMRGNEWWARLAVRNGVDWDPGPWVRVPEDAILPNQNNPTGSAVICHSMSRGVDGNIDPASNTVFCFIRPTES